MRWMIFLDRNNVDKKLVVRTTFHPDSDYASFVGCYKPTKKNGELTYEFVPQQFLKAYVKAWQNQDEYVFLIIEEINRGNCAAVFGDIFQLLDRENGFSKYLVDTDADMTNYLSENLNSIEISSIIDKDIKDIQDIKSGKKLCLPKNLVIWATMNTSDQSLFPMDSAFKRRWAWKYMPIEDCGQNWKIKIGGYSYNWWGFLVNVNDKIYETTHSEDKKLGYWFVKPEDDIISLDEFKSKVMFYLWNDIYKERIGTDSSIFKIPNKEVKDNTFTFNELFGEPKTVERILLGFMEILEIKKMVNEDHGEALNETGVEPIIEPKEGYQENYYNYWSNFRKELDKDDLFINSTDLCRRAIPLSSCFKAELKVGVPDIQVWATYSPIEDDKPSKIGVKIYIKKEQIEELKLTEDILKDKLMERLGLETRPKDEGSGNSHLYVVKDEEASSNEHSLMIHIEYFKRTIDVLSELIKVNRSSNKNGERENTILIITFPDKEYKGKKNDSATPMAKAIEKIGCDRIQSLNLTVRGGRPFMVNDISLLSEKDYKKVKEGYYIFTNIKNEDKQQILNKIKTEFKDLDFIVKVQ
ncbi:MAG: hypothetical protein LIP09_05200 [Bacteroidales bacterium]|nr:hypothetical protein [Bacteroidales bacterium]